MKGMKRGAGRCLSQKDAAGRKGKRRGGAAGRSLTGVASITESRYRKERVGRERSGRGKGGGTEKQSGRVTGEG